MFPNRNDNGSYTGIVLSALASVLIVGGTVALGLVVSARNDESRRFATYSQDAVRSAEDLILSTLNRNGDLVDGWLNEITPHDDGCWDVPCVEVRLAVPIDPPEGKTGGVQPVSLAVSVQAVSRCLWDGPGNVPNPPNPPNVSVQVADLDAQNTLGLPLSNTPLHLEDDWTCRSVSRSDSEYQTKNPLQYQLVFRSQEPPPILGVTGRVVFHSGDKVSGPVHYAPLDGQPNGVLICGEEPTFSVVEISSPEILPNPFATPTAFPSSSPANQNVFEVGPQCIAAPGTRPLMEPTTEPTAPPVWVSNMPGLRIPDYNRNRDCDSGAPPVWESWMENGLRQGSQPNTPGTIPVNELANLSDGSVVWSAGDMTIEYPSTVSDVTTTINGSVTIIAARDIIIEVPENGAIEIESDGGVLSLLAGCNVRLGQIGTGCSLTDRSQCNQNLIFNAKDDVTLKNVAILAPNGGLVMERWIESVFPSNPTQGCNYKVPTFTIEGTVISTYRMVTGTWGAPLLKSPPLPLADCGNDSEIAEPLSDTNPPNSVPVTGYIKYFSHPQDFKEQTPAWWPYYTGQEWYRTV